MLIYSKWLRRFSKSCPLSPRTEESLAVLVAVGLMSVKDVSAQSQCVPVEVECPGVLPAVAHPSDSPMRACPGTGVMERSWVWPPPSRL